MGASEWGKPPNALKGKRGRERRRRRRKGRYWWSFTLFLKMKDQRPKRQNLQN